MISAPVPRRTIATATPIRRAFHVHPDGSHSVGRTGNDQRLAVAPGERIVGGPRTGGNLENIVAVRIERHHALAIAYVDVPQFIHRHAIATPLAELTHVGERAVALDVEDPRAALVIVV